MPVLKLKNGTTINTDVFERIKRVFKFGLFEPEVNERFYYFQHDMSRAAPGTVFQWGSCGNSNGNVKLAFRSQKDVIRWTSAFDCILSMRMCEGAELPEAGKRQWQPTFAVGDITGEIYLSLKWSEDIDWKFDIFPCFDTREHAQAAVDKIGKDIIIGTIKTLHGLWKDTD